MFGRKRSSGRAEPVLDECPSRIRIVRTAVRSGVGTLPRRWPHSSPLLRTASFAALLSFVAVLGVSRWEDARPVSVSGDNAHKRGLSSRRPFPTTQAHPSIPFMKSSRKRRRKSRSLWPKAPNGCSIRHPCQNSTD